MATTISDVARRAGVSTATVSRVLSGIGQARPDTRARVLAAARDLGYRPSGVARSLKLRRTRTIGLIVTDITNPFFPQLVRAVEDAAREREFAVLLCNAAEDPEREAGYLEVLAGRRVDGIVVASAGLGARQAAWIARAPLPVVLVNAAAGASVPTLLSDNVGGARLAVDHLIALGHRSIGHVAGPAGNAAAPDRLAGARLALEAAGLGADRLAVAEGDGHVAGGARATAELLAADPGLTAVFAYNDLSAIGALRALRAAGLRVPADVSVVGFDDVDLAAYADPPLTTVAQDIASLGRRAAERLFELVDGDARPASAGAGPTVLPVRLVLRGSTAPPPATAA